jgi:hypothetical protein
MRTDNVALAQLDRNQLPDKRQRQIARLIEILVDAGVCADDRAQLVVSRFVEFRSKVRLVRGWR